MCEKPFSLDVLERPSPEPAAGEVLVRIRRIGLCGTDYHIFGGRHPYLTYPRVMGHELAGEVEQLPSGSALRIGQRVAINPYIACDNCAGCNKGKPNACANIKVLGIHADGGMCELLAVPERAIVDATGLTLDQAAMVEFLAIGAHAVTRAALAIGARVLVVGAGPIGVAVGLVARIAGAAVTLVDTRAARLNYARDRLGFADVVEAAPGTVQTLSERSGGDMFDTVFDCTGSIEAMAQSLDYVSHGGTLVLVGVATGDLAFADPEFHKRETSLLASRNALRSDFEWVIAAIKAGQLPTDALLTHSFDATDMAERLPELIAGADHVLKAIARI